MWGWHGFLNNEPMLSCLTLAAAADKKDDNK
jgi:hypothetical protein